MRNKGLLCRAALLAFLLTLLATAGCAFRKNPDARPAAGAAALSGTAGEQAVDGVERLQTPGAVLTASVQASDEGAAGSPVDTLEFVEGQELDEGVELTIRLEDLAFVRRPDEDGFQFSSLPEGVNAAVERTSDTTASVTLTGVPAEASEKAEIGLVIARNLFTVPPAADVSAESSVAVIVYAAQCAVLTGDAVQLTEGEALKAGGQPAAELTLYGLEFVDELSGGGFTFTGLPEGVTASVERTGEQNARITLSGTPGGSGGAVELTIARDQFAVPPEEDITVDGTISINVGPRRDPEPGKLQSAVLSGERIELTAGTPVSEEDAPELTVALTGLQFKEELDSAAFEVSGLPEGVDVSVERTGPAEARLRLSGTPAEPAEEVQISLRILKTQFEPEPENDVAAGGTVGLLVLEAEETNSPLPWIIGGCAAAAAVLAAVFFFMRSRKNRDEQEEEPEVNWVTDIHTEYIPADEKPRPAVVRKNPGTARTAPVMQIGKLHNIGRRSSQQDSLGVVPLDGGKGALAVVADGMGGLAGGEQVSQGVVLSMLRQAGALQPGQMDGVLNALVRGANEEVNRQLGPDGLYRCGSTVVAALIREGSFHWISVGDSRVYLYRGGSMLQLNQEHTYEVELMQRVMNGEISKEEADADPQKRGLTSFIGMGRLKYVDASIRRIQLLPGDRLLLMTDGVFNRLPETAMAGILRDNPDLQQAARVLEERVQNLQDPAQDNFTAIIMGYST